MLINFIQKIDKYYFSKISLQIAVYFVNGNQFTTNKQLNAQQRMLFFSLQKVTTNEIAKHIRPQNNSFSYFEHFMFACL